MSVCRAEQPLMQILFCICSVLILTGEAFANPELDFFQKLVIAENEKIEEAITERMKHTRKLLSALDNILERVDGMKSSNSAEALNLIHRGEELLKNDGAFDRFLTRETRYAFTKRLWYARNDVAAAKEARAKAEEHPAVFLFNNGYRTEGVLISLKPYRVQCKLKNKPVEYPPQQILAIQTKDGYFFYNRYACRHVFLSNENYNDMLAQEKAKYEEAQKQYQAYLQAREEFLKRQQQALQELAEKRELERQEREERERQKSDTNLILGVALFVGVGYGLSRLASSVSAPDPDSSASWTMPVTGTNEKTAAKPRIIGVAKYANGRIYSEEYLTFENVQLGGALASQREKVKTRRDGHFELFILDFVTEVHFHARSGAYFLNANALRLRHSSKDGLLIIIEPK